jgi:catechol 2,3-dioxygenase
MPPDVRPLATVPIPPDPEEVAAAGAPAVARIPAETRLGAVHLTVADLTRSVAWYERAVGLRLHERRGGRAALGTGGEDLLVLIEEPGARPADGFCGLYHAALLVPERRDLALWLLHAARTRVVLTGLADHFVSEAAYLADPDHHGVEIYWDRPRQVWAGLVAERMTTLPLDTDDLLRVIGDPKSASFDGLAAGTRVGHVHLRVAELDPAVAFYRDVLGLALMARLGDRAAFLSAGGYHHHVGANTWESAGAPPAPSGTATLRRATVVLPDPIARDRVAEQAARAAARPEPLDDDDGVLLNDPSGNPVALVAEPARPASAAPARQ